MIKDIKLKTSGPIGGTFIISKCEFKAFNTKSGNFLSCELADTSGSIKAVMWDHTEPCKAWLKNKLIVDIVGEVSIYKDVPQIQIKSIAQANKFNMSDFIPSLGIEKICALQEMLLSYRQQMLNKCNPVCFKIWDEILCSPLKNKFIACPGGIGEVHHNYLGGLLEHSALMVKMAFELAENEMKELDRDVLVTGCLIHDIGKMECYNWDSIPEITDAGRLFHHTYVGYGMLLQMADKLGISKSDPTFMKLAHIIVAHHEEEGIRKTMFPEATAVALIDSLNAAANHALIFIGKEENREMDSNWTRFCQLTGRQYYIPKKIESPETPKKTFDLDDILEIK
jgi:3'-5' exoribonuclease